MQVSGWQIRWIDLLSNHMGILSKPKAVLERKAATMFVISSWVTLSKKWNSENYQTKMIGETEVREEHFLINWSHDSWNNHKNGLQCPLDWLHLKLNVLGNLPLVLPFLVFITSFRTRQVPLTHEVSLCPNAPWASRQLPGTIV